jgi:uncharacterized membrane protein YccC
LDDGHVPDRVERVVRFGCGSIVGLMFGLAVALYTVISTASGLAWLAGLFAVVFGVLAVRFDDRFWYALRHMKWFLP